MELIFVAILLYLIMGTVMTILVTLHLSRRMDDQYDDSKDLEETFRAMISHVWKYAEAIDDSATGGAGNTLFLKRMSSRKTQPRQPA